jgi:predicted short-subunit dehydrogenase-like oxidoreductase (DUF2520 family)
MKSLTVSFIGSGNLAWHLAPALDNTDFAVREVFSPRRKHAEALVSRLYEARIHDSLDFSESKSSLFIIAVPDDTIEEVAKEIILPDQAFLIHTSGSQSIEKLQYANAVHTGVFYLLQTFSKSKKVDLKEVPVFIEGSDADTEKILLAMGGAISKNVNRISSETRLGLHLAAVFASNFTNFMLLQAEDIMNQQNLSFDLLKPLIAETVNKSLHIGPEQAQTGPARRADLEVLDKHLEFLKEDEMKASIYKIISQSILDRFND